MIQYKFADGRLVNENKGFTLWCDKHQDYIQYGPGYLRNTDSAWLKEHLGIEEQPRKVKEKVVVEDAKAEDGVSESGEGVSEPNPVDENKEVVDEGVSESSPEDPSQPA